MNRRESKFTSKFHKWLWYRWNTPAYFEIKVSDEDETSIAFTAFTDKQLDNLQVPKFIHKFSDYDRLGTPFDMVCFSGTGYVVLHYWRKGNKEFFIIPIRSFLAEKESSERKSLTEDRAREIGDAKNLY